VQVTHPSPSPRTVYFYDTARRGVDAGGIVLLFDHLVVPIAVRQDDRR
jgi:hypothetical protein